MSRPDLVVFGNLLLDDVVYDDGRTRMAQAGGAALYCALGARLWEIDVGIVSRIGNDYPDAVLQALAVRGIDLGGVREIERPGLRTWLLYEGELRRVIHRLEGPSHADVSPTVADLPAEWRRAASFHLAPMPFSVQLDLVGALGAFTGSRLSLDPYELMTTDRFDSWRRLTSDIDLFLFSEDEMEIEGGRQDPLPILQRLPEDARLQQILFKRGARGGLLYDTRSRTLTEWPPRAERVIDATGAGDAFAGGLLAGLIAGEPMPRALEMGAVSASFAVGAEGAAGLLAADAGSARLRLES